MGADLAQCIVAPQHHMYCIGSTAQGTGGTQLHGDRFGSEVASSVSDPGPFVRIRIGLSFS